MREASAASRDENRPAHTSPEWPGRDTREAAPGTCATNTRRSARGCCRSLVGTGKVTVRLYRGLSRLTESWRGKRQAGIHTWSCLPLLTDGGVHCAHAPPDS
jgi:hypothetical protein